MPNILFRCSLEFEVFIATSFYFNLIFICIKERQVKREFSYAIFEIVHLVFALFSKYHVAISRVRFRREVFFPDTFDIAIFYFFILISISVLIKPFVRIKN